MVAIDTASTMQEVLPFPQIAGAALPALAHNLDVCTHAPLPADHRHIALKGDVPPLFLREVQVIAFQKDIADISSKGPFASKMTVGSTFLPCLFGK